VKKKPPPTVELNDVTVKGAEPLKTPVKPIPPTPLADLIVEGL
jgi:hypothetical protein